MVDIWCVGWIDKAQLECVRVFGSERDAHRFREELESECHGGSHRKITVWRM